jgi:hypothetical protein
MVVDLFVISAFISQSKRAPLDALEADPGLPYRLRIITNAAAHTMALAQRTKAPRSGAVDTTPLDFTWPPGVYSLSHVAIPFSPDGCTKPYHLTGLPEKLIVCTAKKRPCSLATPSGSLSRCV